MIKFEWDPEKARSNLRKHGVSFDEAKSVFYDEFARRFNNTDEAHHEERFLMIGFSDHPRMLMVCHCERNSNESIRIISARKATKKEFKLYTGGVQ